MMIFFPPSLTNPLFRFQPMVADCPRWELVNIPPLIPFSHSTAAWRPEWKVVQCIWFENPNTVPNIGIAECGCSLWSDSRCVGDPSSSPHNEPHRYRTTKAVVGFGKVCHTQTPYRPAIPCPSTICNSWLSALMRGHFLLIPLQKRVNILEVSFLGNMFVSHNEQNASFPPQTLLFTDSTPAFPAYLAVGVCFSKEH